MGRKSSDPVCWAPAPGSIGDQTRHDRACTQSKFTVPSRVIAKESPCRLTYHLASTKKIIRPTRATRCPRVSFVGFVYHPCWRDIKTVARVPRARLVVQCERRQALEVVCMCGFGRGLRTMGIGTN